jgi:two-component system sensor histidine kinase VicK
MEINKAYSLQAIKELGDLSEDGVLIYSIDDSQIRYCNSGFYRILEISPQALSTEGLKVLRCAIKDDDEFLISQINEIKQKSRITGVEMRVASKEEKYIICDAYYIRQFNLIVAFIKDISKTKMHFNYVAEFGARKDAILDMIVHNLSGPLNLTNNLLDLVDQVNRDHNLGKISYYSTLIRENTQNCIETINSFLKQEHFTSEQIAVEANRFNVLAKIKILVDHYRQFASKKEIKLVSEHDELFVTGDDVKFFQIVNNLLSNAVKFTQDAGKITIEVVENPTSYSVSIQDDGIGIPEYFHPHLFEKNTPAGRMGLSGEKSIGMGLYIVKKLITLMNGFITFKSVENGGSTFTVEFPKI